MDFIFKMFFSISRSRGEKEAEGTLFLLSFPVGVTVYVMILTCASYFTRISNMGTVLYSIGFLFVTGAVFYFFEQRYVKAGRYKRLVQIRHRALYMISALFYIFASIIILGVATTILWKK